MKLIAIIFFSSISISLGAQDDSFADLAARLIDSMSLAFTIQDQKEKDQFLNKEFPSFEIQTFTRDTLSNYLLLGKPTIVHVWDLYCQPCFDLMPLLNQLKEKYSGELNFISITKHPRYEVLRFLAQDKFDFTHLIDASEFISNELNFSTIPRTIILDAGNIVREVIGHRQLKNCCGDGTMTELMYLNSLIEKVLQP